MTAELASTKKAADKVSAELESTKGKLDKATTKGNTLGEEVVRLNIQLSQSQTQHDAAVKAGSVKRSAMSAASCGVTSEAQPKWAMLAAASSATIVGACGTRLGV